VSAMQRWTPPATLFHLSAWTSRGQAMELLNMVANFVVPWGNVD
jgi:hypothetical protein